MYKKTKKFRLIFNKKSHKNGELNQNGGGAFSDFFTGRNNSEKKLEPVVEGHVLEKPIVDTSSFLSDNQKKPNDNDNALTQINDKNKSQVSTDALFTASTILTATKAGIAGLALTGVGLPAATALGALVVLIDKMVNLYRNNILLYIAMTDALSIISKSYLLYELILRSYFIISDNKLFYTIKCEGYTGQQIRPTIDDFQNSRLKAKLDELIVLLFGIMRTKDITTLMTDQQLKNTPLGVLLVKEDDKRKEKYKFLGKLNRSLLKKFSAEWYVNEFTKTLTYISAILFNMYALNRSHVERIKKESVENKEKYEEKEECSKERNDFDNPNLQRTTEEALQTVMKGDGPGLVQGVATADKIQQIQEKQINPMEGEGGSFRKRKTRKLLRKFILKKEINN